MAKLHSDLPHVKDQLGGPGWGASWRKSGLKLLEQELLSPHLKSCLQISAATPRGLISKEVASSLLPLLFDPCS